MDNSHIATHGMMRRFLSQRKLVALSLLGLMLILFAAIFAPLIAPFDPMRQCLPARLQVPTMESDTGPAHVLGTDLMGRDILSYIFYGLRVSLVVGFGAVLVSAFLGMFLGMIAGYFGGILDTIIMRLADVQMAVPVIVVALFVMAIFGKGLGKLVLVIGVTGWAVYARAMRACVLSVREKDYIEAQRALGTSEIRIILRHILPNVLTPILVLSAVQLPRIIMLEATMSFLGMGVPILTPSLGIAIANGQKVLYSGAWWVSVFPGITLAAITVNINIVADWLRDVLDPRA